MGSKILIPACTALNIFYKVLTVEHTSPDHSTQVFVIRHNGIRQIKQGWYILVTFALSVSYALEIKNKKFALGGGVVGGVCLGVLS